MKGNVLHFFRDHQICIMTKSQIFAKDWIN